MNRFLTFYNSYKIPVIGLGTSKAGPGQVEHVIKDAIDIGYRHIDCAWIHENETEIGKVLKEKLAEGKVDRKDMFISSKLWNNFHERESVRPALEESMKALQLDYLDLYLMHWPMGFMKTGPLFPTNYVNFSNTDYMETWQAMEECLKDGLVKNIGVSNFNIKQLQRIISNCIVKPVVNQVEVSINFNQRQMIETCKANGIVVIGFSPLGRPGAVKSYRDDPPEPAIFNTMVKSIARKYNRSPAQIILNFLVSLGIGVATKSVRIEHLKENMDIFDFKLHQDDVDILKSLNKNQRVVESESFALHSHYPFLLD